MKIAKSLLPVLTIIYLTGCNTTAKPKEQPAVVKSNEEKIIIIPPIKDRNSVHNRLRTNLPYRYRLGADFGDMIPDSIKSQLTGEYTMEIQADTTKLHIKGDSCWLEYISAGMAHAKRKDGILLPMPTAAHETTDTLKIR